ncbi:cystathionine gamma-synthase [Atractiella rhizophila]|nr:cystathionine gamma-synthase [Atractiella rhizophila]
MSPQQLGTTLLHADDAHERADVAPSISLTTTFRHTPSTDGEFVEFDPEDPKTYLYSRYSTPVLYRLEKVLSAAIGGHTIVYGSGLSAAFGVLMHYQPEVIAITKGYHGVHMVIKKYVELKGSNNVKLIDLSQPFTHPKTLAWVETPLNPTGEVRDLAFCLYMTDRKKLPEQGILVVDSTLAPPPLSDPFKWGVDVIMHSGTKYFGGHSDALMGTISVKSMETWNSLWHTRTYLGLVPGSMEQWLVLRSLRTLHLRVPKQAETGTKIAQWLNGRKDVEKVWHASLQEGAEGLIGKGKQLEAGPACFSIFMKDKDAAARLPFALKLFTPATSLGGVESLIEQRLLSDPTEDPRLVRLSIGVEDFEDLRADLEQGLEAASSGSGK